MADISLRPYQRKFIDDIRAAFRKGNTRVCGVAPCGAGKTIMTAWMIKESEAKTSRIIFFVHRKELIEQTSKTFNDLNIEHGIIAAGFQEQLQYPVQIASVQTLARRINRIPPPNFLICDECHHILADNYSKIINTWDKAWLLGVTATPERLGGIRLGDIFQSMVQAPTVKDLIDMGNLSDFEYFAPKGEVQFSGLKYHFGDYDLSELEKTMSVKNVLNLIINSYIDFANGKSAICYCVNRNHSKLVAQNFVKAGINAVHCDGDTPKALRAQIVNDFRKGKIKILCNAELFGEGFDVPNMDAVILARPTESLTLHVQQSMRPMRPDPNNPNKTAIIIDCVGNSKRHGLPDFPHFWTLDPKEQPPVVDFGSIYKTCPKCQQILPSSTIICPHCGFEFDMRKDIVTSKLERVDKPSAPDIHSIEFFAQVATERNYKPYWAVAQALNFVDSYNDCLHIAQFMGYKVGWAYHQWERIKTKGVVFKRPRV